MQKECEKDCNGDDCTKTCETWCPDCPPGRCESVYPQQTQTSRPSGNFYIYVKGAFGGQTHAAYHGPTVWITVSKDGNSHNYEATRYGDASAGTCYTVINLASYPGPGTIYISAIVRDWPYGPWVDCPATNFTRLSYIMGGVYYDPTGSCSTAQPWTQTSNLGVGYNNGGEATSAKVVSSGDYVGIYAVASTSVSNVSLQLINMPAAYTCSPCNALTCPNKASVAAGSTGNNFFLTDMSDP